MDGQQRALPITVVTPCLNQARFLEATIRSVLLQRYPALEYIVVDGGSTDGSVEIIQKYEPWISTWISEKDRGQSHAINKGLALATGEVAGWLNGDDRLLPGALLGVARAVARAPDAVAWVGSTRTVTADGKLVYPRVEPRDLRRDAVADWGRAGHVPQPSCFFARPAAERVGWLDERYHYAMDVDLWLRLLSVGSFEAVDELWAEETRHADAKTTAFRGRLLAELRLLQIRSGYEQIAMQRLGEELQELEMHRSRSIAAWLKHESSLLLHPMLEVLRARRRARTTR
jgi:glycosyltransferase involved in cell wall biosynthesis